MNSENVYYSYYNLLVVQKTQISIQTTCLCSLLDKSWHIFYISLDPAKMLPTQTF